MDKISALELLEQYNLGIRDFISKDVSGESFREFHIPEIKFIESNLEDADFTGANLERCRIDYCKTLNGTTFDKANLRSSYICSSQNYYTDFSSANLSYSHLSDMTLKFVNFNKTNLSYCVARQLWLQDCYFNNTIIKYSNFLDSYIEENCIFTEVNLEGSLFRYYNNSNYRNFGRNKEGKQIRLYYVPDVSLDKLTKSYILKPHSNLSHADFSRIQGLAGENSVGLSNLNLSYANLSYANLSLVDKKEINLNEVNPIQISPITFYDLNLNFANLNHASLVGLYIFRGNIQNAQLCFCQIITTLIRDTDFSGSSLRYASFKNSHLRNVSFQDCQFENTDFTNTYIYGDAQIPPEVDLSQAHLLPVDAPYPENPSFH
ncbi:MAG: pentapeptide repeat-containing protein [Phormidium sp.]